MVNVSYVLFVGITILCVGLLEAHQEPTMTDTKDGMARQIDEVFSSHLVIVDQLPPIATELEAVNSLEFTPTSIDFDRVAIGEPASRTITVWNRHKNQSVYLGSIMGNVPNVYTSSFSDKVIPPEGETKNVLSESAYVYII